MKSRNGISTLLICIMSLGFSAPLAAKAKARNTSPANVAFTTTDTCSLSGCRIDYDVKSNGKKARIKITYGQNAGALGKRKGSTVHMIVDFGHATIKYLNPVRKLYLTQTGNMKGSPIQKIYMAILASKDTSKLLKETNPRGTMAKVKTINTSINWAEKNIALDPGLFAIPKGYKRIAEGSRSAGGISMPGLPAQIHGGGSFNGGGRLPGTSRSQGQGR